MSKTLIIAEAGVNHNGDINIAKKLIDVAAQAGVDYLKFQTFKAANLVSQSAKKADYQIKNTQDNASQYQMLKKLELSESDHQLLIDYCKTKNVSFLSTAFDLDSLNLLIKLGIQLFKIPSGEITNYPLLKRIGQLNTSVIISTGMCTMQEIKDAIDVLEKYGTKRDNITVLHCNTEYPTPMKDVNLLAMNSIQKEFGVKVGYSDHTLGIEVPIAAVALGASVIEKHFTMDRNMAGPDHAASLEPHELIAMVKGIRNVESALGSAVKQPSTSEIKNISIARKSIHLASDLKAGQILTENDLIMKRPGDGISPMQMMQVIGKKIKKDLSADSKLNWSDIE